MSTRDNDDFAARPPRDLEETLPRISRRRFVRARDPSTIKSAPSDRDASRIASAGSPSQISQVAADARVACPADDRLGAGREAVALLVDAAHPAAGDPHVVRLDDAEHDEIGARGASPAIASVAAQSDEPRLVNGQEDRGLA